jgi:hypothetical protein
LKDYPRAKQKAPAGELGRTASELSIPLQDRATAASNPLAVGSQGGAAPNQVAPGHAAGAIAHPRGGRPAGSQFFHIDGVGSGDGQSEKQNPK